MRFRQKAIFMLCAPLKKLVQSVSLVAGFVTIKLVGDTFDASAQAAQEYTKSEGMTLVIPFDDY